MSKAGRLIRCTAMTAALVGAVACGNDSGTSPELARLSGVYELSDWLYVINGDTLRITSDSYIQIEFLDEEHVTGEGIVWVRAPQRQADGTVAYGRVPLLGLQNRSGEIDPLPIEGWYYVRNTGAADTLRFSLAAGSGKGSWIEAFPWILTENRQTFRFEIGGTANQLRIVHSSR